MKIFTLLAFAVATVCSYAQTFSDTEIKLRCVDFVQKLKFNFNIGGNWSIDRRDQDSYYIKHQGYNFYLDKKSLMITLMSNVAEEYQPHEHPAGSKPFYKTEQELWQYGMDVVYLLYGSECGLQPGHFRTVRNTDLTKSGKIDLLSLTFSTHPYGYTSQGFGNSCTLFICQTNGKVAFVVYNGGWTYLYPDIKYSESDAKTIAKKSYPQLREPFFTLLSYYPTDLKNKVCELTYLVTDNSSTVGVLATTGVIAPNGMVVRIRSDIGTPKLQPNLSKNPPHYYKGKPILPKKMKKQSSKKVTTSKKSFHVKKK